MIIMSSYYSVHHGLHSSSFQVHDADHYVAGGSIPCHEGGRETFGTCSQMGIWSRTNFLKFCFNHACIHDIILFGSVNLLLCKIQLRGVINIKHCIVYMYKWIMQEHELSIIWEHKCFFLHDTCWASQDLKCASVFPSVVSFPYVVVPLS